MASASRYARPFTAAFRSSIRSSRAFAPRYAQGMRQQSGRRAYSSGASEGKSGSGLGGILAVAALAGGGYYYYTINPDAFNFSKTPKEFKPTFEDYQKVYDTIAKAIEDKDEYDDGSYGPVLLRLGWHSSGTYDKATGTGGSNGGTMRFKTEASHGANAGLENARQFLDPIKAQYPWISYGDLWTLAAVCAVQEMQGPIIPWRPGRKDQEESTTTPDGRLPDASQGPPHIRDVFGRMGFNDQEMVALIGGHALGRGHRDRSGYDGPWTFSPTVFTNDFYNLLLNEKWAVRKWDGPKQFEDVNTKSLLMLPTDMALIQDKKFKPWVEKYAKDSDVFFQDFSDAVCKLFELGVPFESKPEDRFRFKPHTGL